MHDQYMMELHRKSKNINDKRLKLLRKRQGRAISTALKAIDALLDWPSNEPLYVKTLWQRIDEKELRESREDMAAFQRLENRGYPANCTNRNGGPVVSYIIQSANNE